MRPEDLYEVVAEDVDLDAPVLVHALGGFLDAGAARQLAVAHLLATHDHRTVAEFDVDVLYDYRARRPRMVFDTDHYVSIDMPELLLSEVTDSAGTGFLLLHGPEPDLGWRTFTSSVVELVERYGVRRSIGSDSLGYVSVEQMVAASEQPRSRLCCACFDGEYPIPLPEEAQLGKHLLEDVPAPTASGAASGDPGPLSVGYGAGEALTRP